MKIGNEDKELTIELTTKCQINCSWCSSQYGKEYELTIDQVIKILEENAEEYSIVRFSGGEPTEYEYLSDAIYIAKSLGYNIILLTNGINKFVNENIDEYHVQWTAHMSYKFVKYLLDNNKNVTINVVNVLGAGVGRAIQFCAKKGIPVHIMKLQNTGNARKNVLTEVNISITGQNGCNLATKKLILPSGKEISCASEKLGNICSLIECDK